MHSTIAKNPHLVNIVFSLVVSVILSLLMYFPLQLAEGQNCAGGEMVIYVHGVWAQLQTDNQADRVALAILDTNYNIPVFLFSWNSSTEVSQNGWNEAKSRTNAYGIELGDDILNYKLHCQDDKVRLIAHSLGSRVVLSALDYLDNNSTWRQNNFRIESVHLMGATVDDEKISLNPSDTGSSRNDDSKVYGRAIQRQVRNDTISFFNLYNLEDDALEPLLFRDPDTNEWIADYDELSRDTQAQYYPFYEDDSALGYHGAQPGADLPSNYRDRNVQSEIIPETDADGDGACDLRNPYYFSRCIIYTGEPGDNHFGYMGFRDRDGTPDDFSDDILIDNGAIDLIVNDWRTQ